jgi:hypothetical protein
MNDNRTIESSVGFMLRQLERRMRRIEAQLGLPSERTARAGEVGAKGRVSG